MTRTLSSTSVLTLEIIDLLNHHYETELVAALFFYHKNNNSLFLQVQREILEWLHTTQPALSVHYLALAAFRAAKAGDLRSAGRLLEGDLAAGECRDKYSTGPDINNQDYGSECFDCYCFDNPGAASCKVFDL
jgi:hypothetical protein